MMSICFKENLKISSQAVAEIIIGTDNDVRQTLTHLSFFTRTNNELSQENAKAEATNSHKDIPLNPWEVCRRTFSGDKKMSFVDKCKLFFYDYSFGPLFIHENYKSLDPGGSEYAHNNLAFTFAYNNMFLVWKSCGKLPHLQML